MANQVLPTQSAPLAGGDSGAIAPGGALPAAPGGTQNVRILRSSAEAQVARDDRVAVEAPLEFLLHHPSLGGEPMSFGTTMRTPGDDEWLAAGLLYGEGIVNRASDIEALESSTRRPNVVNVRLGADVRIVPNTPSRLFSAGSSCGVCGTTGLDAAIARAAATHIPDTGHVPLSLLLQSAESDARGAVEVRRHRRRSRFRALRFFGEFDQRGGRCRPPQCLRQAGRR